MPYKIEAKQTAAITNTAVQLVPATTGMAEYDLWVSNDDAAVDTAYILTSGTSSPIQVLHGQQVILRGLRSDSVPSLYATGGPITMTWGFLASTHHAHQAPDRYPIFQIISY